MQIVIFIALKLAELSAMVIPYALGRCVLRIIDGQWNAYDPSRMVERLACWITSWCVGVAVLASAIVAVCFLRYNWQWAARIMEAL